MILTPAQRRDYSVAVKNGRTANALDNIRVAICFDPDRGVVWWRLHRSEIMAELKKIESVKDNKGE